MANENGDLTVRSFEEREVAGRKVRFRILKVGEILDLAKIEDGSLSLRLIAASVVDRDGNPMFTDPSRQLDWPLLTPLAEKAMELNHLQVEEAEKKSAPTTSSDAS